MRRVTANCWQLLAEHADSRQTCRSRSRPTRTCSSWRLRHAGFTVYRDQPAGGRPLSGTTRPGREESPTRATPRCWPDILRTDRHLHRPLPQISEHARRSRRWPASTRRRSGRCTDDQPAAFGAAGVLPASAQARSRSSAPRRVDVLAAAPTPQRRPRLTRTPDRRSAAPVRPPQRPRPRRTDPPRPARRRAAPARAGRGRARARADRTDRHRPGDAAQPSTPSKQQLAAVFDTHPLAPMLRSAPGLGPILAARVLAEIGDDPNRFASANGLRAFAGTAPVTRASGRSHYVKARKSPQQAPRRRLPLVGFRHADQIARRPRALRPTTGRRRPPQRRPAQPRQQAPRPPVVVPAHRQPWDEHAAWPVTPARDRALDT